MPKEMTNDELQELIDRNITYCKNTLEEFSTSGNGKMRKKAMLIAYWIKDYFKMIRKENDTNFRSLPKYKRGQVLSVNFGFRVGNELGGRHFAIVLDNHNNINSNIITVLPLTSKKEHTKLGRFNYELEFDLEKLYNERFEKLLDQNNRRISELMKRINAIDENPDNYCKDDLIPIKRDFLRVTESIKNMDSIKNNISNLKSGSIVNISQITTISKQRILNPKQSSDGLTGIRIKETDLDNINKKLKELFYF